MTAASEPADEPMGELLALHPDPEPGGVDLVKAATGERVADIDELDEDYGGELVPFDEDADAWAPSTARTTIERYVARPLPTVRQVSASTRWWTVNLGKAGGRLLIFSPWLLLLQVPPILRGLARWAQLYATWRAQPTWLKLAQTSEKDAAKETRQVKARIRANTRLTWIALAVVIGGVLYALHLGQGAAVLAGALLVIALADWQGRKVAPVTNTVSVMPRSAFQEGAPIRMVLADVHAVLVEQGHDPARTEVVDPKVGEYGISLRVHSPREIGDGEVTAIERGLQTFRGAVSLIGEPDNAAVSELRVLWRDPLAEMFTPERLAPNSQTVANPGQLGYGLGRASLLIDFMRVNIILVGGPGAGKSSALWAMIDYLSCCHDVVLHGIDLSGGPALRAWGEVFATRAFDPAAAEALLARNLERARARTEMLAERSEPTADGGAPKSENWTPDDGKFHITIIDELPLLAAYDGKNGTPDLRGMYAEHQRIGRKAGDTSVSATQDLSGDTLGATSLRKYPSTVILMACSREDVTGALGGGKLREGWRPDRLVPAEGDNANDAGKAFIRSGRHHRPNPWRFARLDDMAEIHSRAIERIAAGRPVDDEPIESSLAQIVPAPLAQISAAFQAAAVAGVVPDFMASAHLCAAIADAGGPVYVERQLAAALRPHGVAPADGKRRVPGAPNALRGYLWADVAAALDRLG